MTGKAIRTFAVLLLCLAPLSAKGETAPPATPGELAISADRLDIHQDQAMATFSGSVTATQGSLHMTAARMTIYYSVSDAGDAPREAERVLAEGSVQFRSDTGNAEGEQAEYDPKNRIITLSGAVRLSRAENQLTGDKLTHDLSRGVSVLWGTEAPISAAFRSQAGQAPVYVQATQLEVRDTESKAFFSGRVQVQQTDRRLLANRLTVHFQSQSRKNSTPQGSNPLGAVSFIEANGNVDFRSAEDIVKGGYARYDVNSETIEIKEKVILTRGDNILRGERLTLDLRSGKSRMEGQSGRVQGLFSSPPKKNQTSGQ